MNTLKINNHTNSMFDDSHIIELEKELLGHSEIQGRQNGEQNMPVTEDQLRAYNMNFIETKVQSAINYNHQLYHPISGMVIVQEIKSEAKKNVQTLSTSLADDEHKMRPLEEQKKQLAPDLKKRRLRRCIYTGVGIISAADGYFAYEAFRAAPIPKIPSFFAALSITIAIGFGCHILGGFIRKAQTKIQRIIRYSIVLIPAFAGFFVLGLLRANAYNSVMKLQNSIDGTSLQSLSSISGWNITILSFLLFVVALLFSIKFYKPKEEQKKDQEYDLTRKEINELKNKMQDTQNKIEGIQKETIEKSAEALARYEYAIATENRLKSIARHSMEVYKEMNLRHRKDGLCPIFFSHPSAFNFQTFFDNTKTN